jgi:hypothetical protein
MAAPRGTLTVAFLALSAAALAACEGPGGRRGLPAPILLFNGTGTSRGDVAAIETILNGSHLDYSTADSSQLNAMGESQIREHRLLIVPGGNFIDIGNSLTPGTTANIRGAVRNGVNCLGVCAGGFLAGDSGYNGLNLTSGARFGFYAAEAPMRQRSFAPR